jgi:protein-S-isoprenylcysteine O-methyltransferase Ste14
VLWRWCYCSLLPVLLLLAESVGTDVVLCGPSQGLARQRVVRKKVKPCCCSLWPVVVVLLLAVAPVMALLLLAVARRAAARWGPVVALLLLAMAPVVALLLLAVACRGAPAAGCGPRRGTAAPRCGFYSCCCSLWPVLCFCAWKNCFPLAVDICGCDPAPPAFSVAKSHRRWQPL